MKIPAILLKYVQAVRSPRNLVSRPVRRPNSRSPCHGGCIAGKNKEISLYTNDITFNFPIEKFNQFENVEFYFNFV